MACRTSSGIASFIEASFAIHRTIEVASSCMDTVPFPLNSFDVASSLAFPSFAFISYCLLLLTFYLLQLPSFISLIDLITVVIIFTAFNHFAISSFLTVRQEPLLVRLRWFELGYFIEVDFEALRTCSH